jgi:hypothetical protein
MRKVSKLKERARQESKRRKQASRRARQVAKRDLPKAA